MKTLNAVYKLEQTVEHCYVYVAHSPSIPHSFKVGSSKNPSARVRSLSDGLPQAYHIMREFKFQSKDDARIAEKNVHRTLEKAGKHIGNECFSGPLEEIIYIIADEQRTSVKNMVTVRQMQYDSVKTRKVSISKGVDFHKGSGKWRARKRVNGIQKYLGAYNTKEDAQLAIKKFVESIIS